MRLSIKSIQNLALNPWFIIIAGLCSIVTGCWLLYEKAIALGRTGVGLPIFLFAVLSAVYLTGICLTILVFSDNKSLRRIPYYVHRINHIYRDTLYKCFGDKNPKKSLQELAANEKATVISVCQKIAKIYNAELKGRDCIVTVKLITKDDKNRAFCEIYVRSEESSPRDQLPPHVYEIGTGANTAFDSALRIAQAGKCSHFYSGDLTREDNYNNQRPHWENFYRSTIVVPIRGLNQNKLGQPDASDDIGFLCVDTMSRNRLNDGYHVELLAAFADQMYNFFCLMRGKYTFNLALSARGREYYGTT